MSSPFFAARHATSQSETNRVFVYAFEYAVPASLYTFAGDMTRLNVVSSELETEWQVWSSFSGITIHGLDEAEKYSSASLIFE